MPLREAWARLTERPSGPPQVLRAPPLPPGSPGPVVLGRSRRCDYVLQEPSVSRCHAMLLRAPAGWTLFDLGSTNGTRVNGWRVGRAVLKEGDEVELGTARLTFADRSSAGRRRTRGAADPAGVKATSTTTRRRRSCSARRPAAVVRVRPFS